MKIENTIKTKYKLLKLKIIKSKLFKKNLYLKNMTLEDIVVRIKKALHIIYLYHINNKRILFVGNSFAISKEMSKLLKNTKHTFIPKSTWIAGVITNQYSSFKSMFKQETKLSKVSQKLLQLKQKSDLVVIIDQNFERTAIEESYTAKLPVVVLNSNLNPFDFKSNYKIQGNFNSSKNKIKHSLFNSILIATLKKAARIKKTFTKLFPKLKTVSTIKKSKTPHYFKHKKRFFK
jgi:ribosomal protein S2